VPFPTLQYNCARPKDRDSCADGAETSATEAPAVDDSTPQAAEMPVVSAAEASSSPGTADEPASAVVTAPGPAVLQTPKRQVDDELHRVCLVDSLLCREINNALCPICRTDVLMHAPPISTLQWNVSVTLWNLIQMLHKARDDYELSSERMAEEEQEYSFKLDQLQAKWQIQTLQHRANEHHRRRLDDETEDWYGEEGWEDMIDQDNAEVRVERTEVRGRLVERNIMRDDADVNEDGYNGMRLALGLVDFPRRWDPNRTDQVCNIVLLQLEEDEDMAEGFPWFVDRYGDDDMLIVRDYHNEIRLEVKDDQNRVVFHDVKDARSGRVSFADIRLENVTGGRLKFRFQDDAYDLHLEVDVLIGVRVEGESDDDGEVEYIQDEAGEWRRRRDDESDDAYEFEGSEESDDSFIVAEDEVEEADWGEDEGHWFSSDDDNGTGDRRRSRRRRQRRNGRERDRRRTLPSRRDSRSDGRQRTISIGSSSASDRGRVADLEDNDVVEVSPPRADEAHGEEEATFSDDEDDDTQPADVSLLSTGAEDDEEVVRPTRRQRQRMVDSEEEEETAEPQTEQPDASAEEIQNNAEEENLSDADDNEHGPTDVQRSPSAREDQTRDDNEASVRGTSSPNAVDTGYDAGYSDGFAANDDQPDEWETTTTAAVPLRNRHQAQQRVVESDVDEADEEEESTNSANGAREGHAQSSEEAVSTQRRRHRAIEDSDEDDEHEVKQEADVVQHSESDGTPVRGSRGRSTNAGKKRRRAIAESEEDEVEDSPFHRSHNGKRRRAIQDSDEEEEKDDEGDDGGEEHEETEWIPRRRREPSSVAKRKRTSRHPNAPQEAAPTVNLVGIILPRTGTRAASRVSSVLWHRAIIASANADQCHGPSHVAEPRPNRSPVPELIRSHSMAKPGFYAVAIGRTPGIYDTWAAAEAEVKGYTGARYKKFSAKPDADAFMLQHGAAATGSSSTATRAAAAVTPTPAERTATDAAKRKREDKGSVPSDAKKARADAPYYVVAAGKTPGVYTSWPDVVEQIEGVTRPVFRKFESMAAAEAFLAGYRASYESKTAPVTTSSLVTPVETSPIQFWYAVARGRQTGVFATWKEAKEHVEGLFSAVFKKFPTREEAEAFVEKHQKSTTPISDDPNPKDPDTLVAFCDGSALQNGRRGCQAGYACIFPHNTSWNVAKKLVEAKPTNNRAEYLAALEGMKRANIENPSQDQPLFIFSDSMLLIRSMREWIDNWVKKNWVKADGEPVQNRDLLEKLIEARGKRRIVWRSHGEEGLEVDVERCRRSGCQGGRALMNHGVISSAMATHESYDDFDAPVDIMPKEINLTGEADEKLPNTLVIKVIQARNLPMAKLRSSMSCYVKLSSLGKEYKTTVQTTNEDPIWNETFTFRAVDWASHVTLSVRDKINVKMRFIGQVRISSSDISNRPGMTCQEWFRLRDLKWEKKESLDAEIELKVSLIYSPRNDPFVSKEVAAAMSADDEVIGINADQDEETEEEAFARRKQLERMEKERTNSQYMNLKHGDYQVQVHIIEARDLKGENWSGTSDPYCQVEVMGKKKSTSTKNDTLGCVFDEILFFHFKNIGRNELKQATIKITIFDKDMLTSNLIGSYQLDCLNVYFRPHHELYRQWIAVHDHLSENDHGVQGFLLVSINVIGPGDTFRVHDREAEMAQELAMQGPAGLTDTPAGPDAQSPLVLLPPSLEVKVYFLLVKVFKAEDLPAMDLLPWPGIDAYVQIGFGPNPKCKTLPISVKGSSNLSAVFLDELWIPVITPTLSRSITISVWDYDRGRRDDLVGITLHDYQQVAPSTAPGGTQATAGTAQEVIDIDPTDETVVEKEKVELRWFNLYGPPLRKINKKRAKLMSENPDFASTYRGRVLLSMERVENPPPDAGDKFRLKEMDSAAIQTWEKLVPRTMKCVLLCALYCGVEVPHHNSIISGATKVRVTISIGSYEIIFDPQAVKDGKVYWEECKERWPIVLPVDITQHPDIIVTLSRQIDKNTAVSISYARFAASERFLKGFSAKSEWIALKEDISRRQTKYALEKAQSPGSLLLRLGYGREEVAVRTPWGEEDRLFASFRHHTVHREVRVHIFQCRGIVLPEGKMRLPNPYVLVNYNGEVKRTAVEPKTVEPLFYESLVFMMNVPKDLAFVPDIIIQLHDANVSPTGIPQSMLGEVRVSMSKGVKTVPNGAAPRPSWYPLRPHVSDELFVDEHKGRLLMSIQYIDHNSASDHLVPPQSLRPECEDANLEVVALGVRHLKALSLLGVRNPHLEVELSGGVFADGTTMYTVDACTTTYGKNANFLEHRTTPARLPVDTLYAPQLTIRVCEKSLNGFRKTVVASCVVDLGSKLPWSSEYVPPQTQAFENPNMDPNFRGKRGEKALTGMKKLVARMKTTLGVKRKKEKEAASEEEDEYMDEPLLEEGADKEKSEEVEVDTGIGIGGGLMLEPVCLFPVATVAAASKKQDPAIQQQLQLDEERRYAAGRADMVGGRRRRAAGQTSKASPALGEPGALHDDKSEEEAALEKMPYLKGRDWWVNDHNGEELEKYLRTKALETYPLYRSVLTRPSLLSRKKVRVQLRAGVFKGLITVTERRKKGAPKSNLLDLERLKEPEVLEVRVYVLRANNLQSKDFNGYSDPYLRLKLGKTLISDRSHHKKKTLNPHFHRAFKFTTTLPGPSQLDISVWDHDLIGADDLIGTTTIDLEDRWFHRDWQKIGKGDEKDKLQNVGIGLKPIENRHLYMPHLATSQGVVQLWVDIINAKKAALIPMVDIEPPKPEKFEVRVVIWRAEGVTDKDHSEVNDYFVKVWMEGGKAMSTDVHWRCSNGRPCWNWRFKLPVEYPLRAPEFGHLHLQLWDKDVIKYNDIIGEAQLDLYKWIRRAYQQKRTVAPFKELKDMSRSKETGGQEETANSEAKPGEKPPVAKVGDGSESEGEDTGDESGSDAGPAKENHSLLVKKGTKKGKKASETKSKSDAKKKPTVSKNQKDSDEARAALNGLLDFVGLGNLPDDAEWISIFHTDRETGKSMNMGKMGVSIQILPFKEAEANAVGNGRGDPNMNPFLPPPVGRMRLTANPIMMMKELIGPAMCLRITICLCCLGCTMFFAMFGGTLMSTLTYIQGMKRSDGAPAPFQLPDFPSTNATGGVHLGG
ncbi:TPA: hypothetical protein N0F65_007483, partial [Lagenidium giganteum]